MGVKFSKIILWVQDTKLASKFYAKLGFTIVKNDDDTTVMRLGTMEVFLISLRDEELFARDVFSGDKGRGCYFYLSVEDVDIAYASYIEKGLEPHTQPHTQPWGAREFIMKDPDGYKWCIAQEI